MELLTMNSGERHACLTPDAERLRALTLFAQDGFGDASAIFPQLAGVTVSGKIIGSAAVFRVEAEKHVLASAYVAGDETVEAEVWEAAESAYLRDSDKYAKAMQAEACPQKPVALPWAAITLWPIMYRQEGDNALANVREVVAAVALGALNAIKGRRNTGGNSKTPGEIWG